MAGLSLPWMKRLIKYSCVLLRPSAALRVCCACFGMAAVAVALPGCASKSGLEGQGWAWCMRSCRGLTQLPRALCISWYKALLVAALVPNPLAD